MWYPLKDQKIEFCSLSLLKHKYKYWMRAFLRIQKLLLGEEFSSAFVRNGQKRNCIFRNLHVWIELLYHSRYGGHLYSINIYFIANRFSFSFPCFMCLFLVYCPDKFTEFISTTHGANLWRENSRIESFALVSVDVCKACCGQAVAQCVHHGVG